MPDANGAAVNSRGGIRAKTLAKHGKIFRIRAAASPLMLKPR
jgi:hypothetical protein